MGSQGQLAHCTRSGSVFMQGTGIETLTQHGQAIAGSECGIAVMWHVLCNAVRGLWPAGSAAHSTYSPRAVRGARRERAHASAQAQKVSGSCRCLSV